MFLLFLNEHSNSFVIGKNVIDNTENVPYSDPYTIFHTENTFLHEQNMPHFPPSLTSPQKYYLTYHVFELLH